MKLLIIILILTPCTWAKTRCPWTLESCYEVRARYLITADVDNDGNSELVEAIGPYAFVRDQNGSIKEQINFPCETFFPVEVFQSNQKFIGGVFFQVRQQDTVYLCVYDLDGTRHSFPMFAGKDLRQAGNAGYDGNIQSITVRDMNKDGYPDLFCNVATGFDLYPRGVLAFDYKNSEELWHFWCGSMPCVCAFTLYDIDHNGEEEIIFGTGATSNGGDYNGIDDSRSWVIVLNNDGTLRWKKSVGGPNSIIKLWVGDLYANGRPVIVVCEDNGLSDKKGPNSLTIYDAQTAEILKYIGTGERFLGMYVCDLTRNGRMEIITGNSDGILRIFDQNLDPLMQRVFPVGVRVEKIADLNGNGTNEIIIITQEGGIKILDEKLKTLCDFKIEQGHIEECFLARDGKRFNIVTRMHAGIEHIYTVYKVNSEGMFVPSPPYLIACMALIAVSVGLLFVTLYRAKEIKKIHSFIENTPCGLILINKKRKIRYVNQAAKNLIGLTDSATNKFLNLDEVKVHLENLQEQNSFDVTYNHNNEIRHFLVELRRLNRDTMAIIHDRTKDVVSDSVISWAELAQKLAHEVKNPLSTINLTLQHIQEISQKEHGRGDKTIDKYVKSALEEVDRLRHTTDKFMRVLSIENPVLKPHNIHNIIDMSLQRCKYAISDQITLTKHFASSLPSVTCDEKQIIMLFVNIFENACDAIKNKGCIIIWTSVIEQLENKKMQKKVEIKIEDSGQGMSKPELDSLYIPFQSTKPGGTGIGLIIAREIVRRHKGTIDITSKEDIGTVVTIHLPVGVINTDIDNE